MSPASQMVMILALANEIATFAPRTPVSRNQASVASSSADGSAESGKGLSSVSAGEENDFRLRWLQAIARSSEDGTTARGADQDSDEGSIEIASEGAQESLPGPIASTQITLRAAKDLVSIHVGSAAAGDGAVELKRRPTDSFNAEPSRRAGSEQSDASAGKSVEKSAGGSKLITRQGKVSQTQTKNLDQATITSGIDLIASVTPPTVVTANSDATMHSAIGSAEAVDSVSASTVLEQDRDPFASEASGERSIEMSSLPSTPGEKSSTLVRDKVSAISDSGVEDQAALEVPNESAEGNTQDSIPLTPGAAFTTGTTSEVGDGKKTDRIPSPESISNLERSNPQIRDDNSNVVVPVVDENGPSVAQMPVQKDESSGHTSETHTQRIKTSSDGRASALRNSGVTDSVDMVAGITVVRDPAQVIAAHEARQSASLSAEQSAADNTFSALDASGGTGRMSWTHASPQHAEAGFVDPSLGWVSVRADLHGGAVHAAVVASSSDSASTLGGELVGLSAHLAERQIPVESVSVSTAGDQQTNSSGTMQNGNGQSSEHGAQQSEPISHPLPMQRSALNNIVFEDSTRGNSPYVASFAGKGMHVSVMV
jgi:hypothetical protein